MKIEIQNNIDDEIFTSITDKINNQILDIVGQKLLDESLPNVPVSSGKLRDNTFYEVNDGQLEFKSDTDYADIIYDKYKWFDNVTQEAITEEINNLLKEE